MNYKNILVEKLERERNEFKQKYSDMQPLQVYKSWYKITFYEEYYGMLTSDFIDRHDYEDIIKWLCGFENPLEFLYDEWLAYDSAFSGYYDDMWIWIRDLYDEVMYNKSLEEEK